MISIGILIVFICSFAAWIYSALFLLLSIENHRFWKSNFQFDEPDGDNFPRVCVMVPCKGTEPDMHRNLTSFMRQNHPNFQVLFVVESRDDPAVDLIQQVCAENHRTHSRLLIAGRAMNNGQKVHNLCRAVDSLSNEIDIYAFADCDAATGDLWLQWLVDCIGRNGVGARTGYRWMTPGDKRIPTFLACSANNVLASMMGRGGHHLIWGGSWAIHRSIFKSTGIRDAWEGVVSDDLAASRALRLARLKILFGPKCVCTTEVKHTWSSLFEFFRRQLLIARRYTPGYWTTALLTTTAVQTSFWGGIAVATQLFFTGQHVWATAFACSVAGLYGLSIARAAIRQKMDVATDKTHQYPTSAGTFDLLGGPVTGLFMLMSFIASSIGNVITWRGIHYHLGPAGTVRLLGRSIEAPWPVGSDPKNCETTSSVTDSAGEPVATRISNCSNRKTSTSSNRRNAA